MTWDRKHWWQCSDTKFIDGEMRTDATCRVCHETTVFRQKYLPWNAPTSPAAYTARTTSRSLAEERMN